ncbi:hypothetical protein [Granulicatella adiacens]
MGDYKETRDCHIEPD